MTPQAVVAVAAGHAPGGNGALVYGAAVPGTDTWQFDFGWDNYYSLSFSGSRMLGSTDRTDDLTAAADQFTASSEFRSQILPIIQSLTASAAPAPGGVAPEAAGESTCGGARFVYENLQGVTCEEAKFVLQEVLDTGAPQGARSRITDDFECYETSYVERTEGLPDMTCWALTDEGLRDYPILDANYR
ncbi:hypothetical protein [Arthrobacter sp. MDT1-65]